MTVEYGFFINPLQVTSFSNSSGIPIQSNILKLSCSNILLEEIVRKVFIDTIDSKYKHNCLWDNKEHNLTPYTLFLVLFHYSHKILLVP